MSRICSYFLALIIMLLATTVMAADNRWVCIEDDGIGQYYLDSKTTSYDSAANTVKFWVKYEQNSRIVNMDYYLVDISNTKYGILRSAFYQNKTYPEIKNYENVVPRNLIWPDDILEKAANIVCDNNNVKHMYPGGADRWHWLYSTEQCTYNYAPGMVFVDKEKRTVIMWTQSVYPEHGVGGVTRWVCDFNENMVEYTNSRGVYKQYVLPDTLEEAVWEKAEPYMK